MVQFSVWLRDNQHSTFGHYENELTVMHRDLAAIGQVNDKRLKRRRIVKLTNLLYRHRCLPNFSPPQLLRHRRL